MVQLLNIAVYPISAFHQTLFFLHREKFLPTPSHVSLICLVGPPLHLYVMLQLLVGQINQQLISLLLTKMAKLLVVLIDLHAALSQLQVELPVVVPISGLLHPAFFLQPPYDL